MIVVGDLLFNENYIEFVRVNPDKCGGDYPKSEVYLKGWDNAIIVYEWQAKEILKKFKKGIDK